MINEEKLEDVIEELKVTKDIVATTKDLFKMGFPDIENSSLDYMLVAISDAIDLLTPREITKEEWWQWKKYKHRDPLYYIWTDDATLTPLLAMKSSDIHEPAYLMGQIKIFNTKPTRAQRMKMINERETMENDTKRV